MSYYARWIREGRLPVNAEWNKQGIKFTVQDPCQLVRKSLGDTMADDLRYVARRLVGEDNFVDMAPSRSANYCCGGGGGFLQAGMKEARYAYGKRKFDQITTTQADYVLTPCHNCHTQIDRPGPAFPRPLPRRAFLDLDLPVARHPGQERAQVPGTRSGRAGALSMSTRPTRHGPVFETEVLIVGGGVTGTGVMRDLALRGIIACSSTGAISMPGHPEATTACCTAAAGTQRATRTRPRNAGAGPTSSRRSRPNASMPAAACSSRSGAMTRSSPPASRALPRGRHRMHRRHACRGAGVRTLPE